MSITELKELLSDVFNNNEEGKGVYRDELTDFTNKLLEYKNQHEFKLYKYSKLDFYSIQAIESEKIYLSKAGEMNDIFEGIQIPVDDICGECLNINYTHYTHKRKIKGV